MPQPRHQSRSREGHGVETVSDHKGPRIVGAVITGLAIAMVLYHLFTGYFPAFPATAHRSWHLTLVLILAILMKPLKGHGWRSVNLWAIIDGLMIAVLVVLEIDLLLHVEDFHYRNLMPTTSDLVASAAMTLIVLECTRRIIGWIMVGLTGVFLLVALGSEYLPGIFYGPPVSLKTMLSTLYLTNDGIFGMPIAIMATYVVLFIAFGSLLNRGGAGRFFMELALALTGTQVGGPAKASVVSSALLGTLTGSAIGNAMTTGAFTIPLMRRVGFQPTFAAAVEAVASTGGQIMPPVMGAVAFIMAEFMGVPYARVALAAALPAVLYFLTVFTAIHFQSLRQGLKVLRPDQLPRLLEVLRWGWHLFIPLALIVYLLAIGRSVQFTAFWATVSVVIVSLFRPETRMRAKDIVEALIEAGRSTVPVSVASAAAGIIIAAVFTSGLSYRFSALMLDFAQGRLWLALLLTAVAAILMGMGITTSAVYLTLGALVIPALIQMGVEPMAGHLFALYYAIIGFITPPVALVSFAAAAVAGTPPMRTAVTSALLGLPVYFLPFIFVYHPALLLIGSPSEVILTFVSSALGVIALAAAIWGYLHRTATAWERVILGISGLLLLDPGTVTNIIGAVLLGSVWILQRSQGKVSVTAPDREIVDIELPAVLVTDAGPVLNATGWKQWGLLAVALAVLTAIGTSFWHLRAPLAFTGVTIAIGLILTLLMGFAPKGRGATTAPPVATKGEAL